MIFRLSRRFVLLNVVLVAVAVVFAVLLIRDYSRKIPLPPAPPPRRAQASASPEATPASTSADEKLTIYNVIVAKHLFNPSRSEGGPAPTAPAPPPPPKPTLLGVVVDGQKSRAYLEDAVTKRVFGYRIGDSVSGGRLDKITDDKVVIVRPDGAIDVLLRDPSKPKPQTPTSAGAPAQPGQPAVPQAGAPQPSSPGAPPGQPPMTPRAVRRLPVDPQTQPQPQPPQQ
jgi:hypothetical protein